MDLDVFDVFGRFLDAFWTFLDFLDVFRRKYLDIFGYIWTYLDAQARGQTQIAQFGLLRVTLTPYFPTPICQRSLRMCFHH